MNLKKQNFVICLILAFAAGFGASCLFGNISIASDRQSGDISKASRYYSSKEDPQLAELQKRLQTDEAFFKRTSTVMSILQQRVNELSDLTEQTIAQCSEIDELKDQLDGLSSLNIKAFNTNMALTSVADGLQRMAKGQNVPEYEQNANNAVAGFRKIESQMNAGKSFVEAASLYLKGKEDPKYSQLADLVSKWTIYGYFDAKLNNSENNVAYWNGKFNEMTEGNSKILLISFCNELNSITHAINSINVDDIAHAADEYASLDNMILMGLNADELTIADELTNTDKLAALDNMYSHMRGVVFLAVSCKVVFFGFDNFTGMFENLTLDNVVSLF